MKRHVDPIVNSMELPARYQVRYLYLRHAGIEHDSAFSECARLAARTPLLPFADGDTISFYSPPSLNRMAEYKISDDFNQQVSYWRMRSGGQSHRMAELLAVKKFPAIRGTDSTFMTGSHMQDSVMDGVRQRMAAADGVETNGKRYISGLARFPGDPEAWVSGLSDVRRICTDRGWNCHGAFEYEAPEPWTPPAPDIPIAPDIVRDRVSAELAAYDPGEITPRLAEDITERMTRSLAGQVDGGQELKVGDYSYEDSVEISQPD